MKPYLTNRGKWLFAAGAIAMVAAVLIRQPAAVLFSQMPVAVLVVALAVLLPAARCLDRRDCRLWLETPGGTPGVMQLSRDQSETVVLWIENRSSSPIFIRRLITFCTGPVEVDDAEEVLRVEAGRRVSVSLDATSQGIGRGGLQGVDVELIDRWGLLASCDFLPCLQVFETRPAMSRRPAIRRRAVASRKPAERVVDDRSRTGTRLRELRDFQPGDPLRTVAWKATVRHRRLITREFDDERRGREYVALDVSSSMRAGLEHGEKFDHAIEVVAQLCAEYLDDDREVGLLTFDEALYGSIPAGRTSAQRRRIRCHLAGLRSVVDADRTALDDGELREMLADYLLVQERLDFRHGEGLGGEVDPELLDNWLEAIIGGERRSWASGVVREARRIDPDVGWARELLQLRGIPLAPHAEVRAGAKARGLADAIEEVVRESTSAARLTVVTDLCGIGELDALEQPVGVAARQGMKIRILAPFTPDYGAGSAQEEASRQAMLRQLFSLAEHRDRAEVARRLAGMGLSVRFIGPR